MGRSEVAGASIAACPSAMLPGVQTQWHALTPMQQLGGVVESRSPAGTACNAVGVV
jgi:hypothetical protein